MKQNPNGIYSSDQKTDLELLGYVTTLVNLDLRKFEEELDLCLKQTKYNDTKIYLQNARNHMVIIESRAKLYCKVAPHIQYMLPGIRAKYNKASDHFFHLLLDECRDDD
jgi:hypothetical protein